MIGVTIYSTIIKYIAKPIKEFLRSGRGNYYTSRKEEKSVERKKYRVKLKSRDMMNNTI